MKKSLKRSLQLLTTVSILGASFAVAPVGGISVTGISANTVLAQQSEEARERKTRRAPAMRAPAFRKLEAAQMAMEEKDYVKAEEELEDLANMRGLNGYEAAMRWNYRAFLYYELEDMDRAINAYEMVLQQPAIPVALEDNIRFTVAQLYFATEQYEKSLEYMNEWFKYQEEPGALPYIFVGQAYYALGRFDEAYLANFPIALVQMAGEPIAFANLWTTPDGREFSVDLMRHGAGSPHGVMDYLFTELGLWGKANGYAVMDLGMAPLSGLEAHRLAPLLTRLGTFVYQRAGSLYGFDGLRKYKNKFQPDWEPLYLAAPGRMMLPAALGDVALLTSGGLLGLFGRGRARAD